MLHPQTIEFLKGLEDFNDKKFFDLYKPLYSKIKEDFEKFIDFLIKEISKFDKSIVGLETKKCTFRIYKDMRFPRNRENPYKTNLGAHISINGKNFDGAGYYIHIQNDESFFAGGVYKPNTQKANQIRSKIYNNRKSFEKIIKNKKFIQTFGKVFSYHNELKKIPKEFDLNHPSIKYLKYKDRLVHKTFKNDEILNKNIAQETINCAKYCRELNDFLNQA